MEQLELLTRSNYFIQHVGGVIKFYNFLNTLVKSSCRDDHILRKLTPQKSLPNQILMKLLKSQNHWYNELSWHCIQQIKVSHVLQAGVTYISRCTTTYYTKSHQKCLFIFCHPRLILAFSLFLDECKWSRKYNSDDVTCLFVETSCHRDLNVFCFKTLSHTGKCEPVTLYFHQIFY